LRRRAELGGTRRTRRRREECAGTARAKHFSPLWILPALRNEFRVNTRVLNPREEKTEFSSSCPLRGPASPRTIAASINGSDRKTLRAALSRLRSPRGSDSCRGPNVPAASSPPCTPSHSQPPRTPPAPRPAGSAQAARPEGDRHA
jgi:hypothetical protein